MRIYPGADDPSLAAKMVRTGLWVLALCVLAWPESGDATQCLRGSRGMRVRRSSASRRAARSVDTIAYSDYDNSPEAIKKYLAGEYENKASRACNKAVRAEWEYITDLGNSTKREIYNQASLDLAAFEKQEWWNRFRELNPDDFNDDPLVQRQVECLLSLGVSALNETALTELNKYELRMQNLYSTAKICPYKNQKCNLTSEGLSLDPDIEGVMSTSRDYDELSYTWKAWHDASGKLMREDYKGYVRLQNAAARGNGFEDMGEMWQTGFESDTFYEDMLELWDQVFPLYEELHKFVRHRLRLKYGDKMGPENDTYIPAHILGNMWAQSWLDIYDLVEPYPNAKSFDITKGLAEQGYTPLKMFKKSDEFYKSLGLKPNQMSYGPNAFIEKPKDRDIICHGSAWDFCDGTDFRIKMCTKVDQEDFRTIHHEMGHIQYYIQYKDLPYMLRSGANPGFHEAIGDTIALSVTTPKHLTAIGLLTDFEDSDENDINALMKMALEKVAFLPFGLLVDLWRWDVFNGTVPEDQWNAHWWDLRKEKQRVKPPVDRSEDDFDPGAKFHVPGSYQYISYFVAHILQFQLYRALCIEAGQYPAEPLHKCDFYNSTAAGERFSKGMALGASIHWSEVLQELTGETSLNASALLEYFDPLYQFLVEENNRNAAPAVLSTMAMLLPTAIVMFCNRC